MNADMTALENAVIDKLTRGDMPELGILREQWETATVASRHCDGRGFWLVLETSPDSPRVAHLTAQLGDVSARLPALELGMEFDLWIADGAITGFEGATYHERLPDNLSAFTLEYLTQSERDWAYVKRVLAGGSTEWPPRAGTP